MSENKKKDTVFLPLEQIAEIAGLRLELVSAQNKEAQQLHKVHVSTAWQDFENAENARKDVHVKLDQAEKEFKEVCEDIWEETEDKDFPGGKIKMVGGIAYDPPEAVKWAAKMAIENEEFFDMLKIDAAKFKAQCKGVAPKFVEKFTAGKFYLDGDLTDYLEGGDGG